jgi:hypothetical protein
MDRQSADLLAPKLDLAQVESRPAFELKPMHRCVNGGSTMDRCERAIEHGEEGVAGGVDLATIVSGEVGPHRGPIPVEQRTPALISQLDEACRGLDDVGEQQADHRTRRQKTVDQRG